VRWGKLIAGLLEMLLVVSYNIYDNNDDDNDDDDDDYNKFLLYDVDDGNDYNKFLLYDDDDGNDYNKFLLYNVILLYRLYYLGHYYYNYPEEIQKTRNNFGSKLFFYRAQLIHGNISML